jgi:hypothetical protein
MIVSNRYCYVKAVQNLSLRCAIDLSEAKVAAEALTLTHVIEIYNTYNKIRSFR